MEINDDSKNKSAWQPNFRELIEAVEDESHPYHEEAVRRNQELAAKMKPLMHSMRVPLQEFSKSIGDSFKSLGIVKLTESLDNGNQCGIAGTQFLGTTVFKPEFLKSLETNFTVNVAPVRELPRISYDLMQNGNERIEREKQSIELLTAMVAQITELNRRVDGLSVGINDVNSSIQNSDENASKFNKSSIRVGVATLVFTILTLVASALFFVSSRYGVF